ncbi:MAG: hypothetical protein PW734_07835 [Verrucomicrobium sp.]|nr:hypothetical protein [Verrucomicrobium sp.]
MSDWNASADRAIGQQLRLNEIRQRKLIEIPKGTPRAGAKVDVPAPTVSTGIDPDIHFRPLG